MADPRAAVRRGILAAAKLQKTLGVREAVKSGAAGVDVFSALHRCHVPVIIRPLDGVLGVYVRVPTPGVLITTKRPLSVQRFTAAHELGHHILGHSPSLDDESILRRSPFSGQQNYATSELEADSFAAEFLIPQWLVAHHCRVQDWRSENLKASETVYQLALRVGCSYIAMCQALRRFQAIDYHEYRSLVSVSPAKIKERLLDGYKPESGWSDVWVLTERDHGKELEGSRTDLFLIKLREHSSAGYLWTFDELCESQFAHVYDRREALSPGRFGSDVVRRILAQSRDRQEGALSLHERRPWSSATTALRELRVPYRLLGPVPEGLSPAEYEATVEGHGS